MRTLRNIIASLQRQMYEIKAHLEDKKALFFNANSLSFSKAVVIFIFQNAPTAGDKHFGFHFKETRTAPAPQVVEQT